LLDLVAQEMLDDPSADLARIDVPVPAADASAAAAEPSTTGVEPLVATIEAPLDDDPPVWAPRFDRSDDLDGLLAPRGKLLRRAFGTDPQT
jgi:hypothetical protein